MSYREVPIGAAFDVRNGATPASGEAAYWDGDIPWVCPADLGRLRTRFVERGERSITAEGYASCGTQMVPSGTIILSIRAPIGHMAIASQSMCFSQGCRGLVPRRIVRSDFAYWALSARTPQLEAAGQGTTFVELARDKLRSERIPLPDLPTQKAVADFLDRETARIDQLIEKKQRFLLGVSARIEALVDQAISDPGVPRTRFENLVRRVQRPVILSEHEELVRLGLYNRGRGIFKKPSADEEGMGASDFFFVMAGDLILSGQFAWEGAVALATSSEEGCVVSHRYPVYRGRPGVNTAYLLGLFRSSFGDFLLNEASRGSAGRNRPLNTWRLGKEKIPIPGTVLQSAVESAVEFERRLKEKTEVSIGRLNEFRAALITAAVTGQIDVDTWSQQGQTDRRLDQMEEATAS